MDSRRKGADGERELAAVLQEYGYRTRRTAEPYLTGRTAPDVSGLPGVHIEVKRVEHLQLEKAVAQAERDARPQEIPAVFHRKNRSKWLVTVPLADFMKLYRGARY